MMVKVISVHQPWASLIIHGLKRIETRSWQPHHRGKIAIHAAKFYEPTFHDDLAAQEPFKTLLAGLDLNIESMPRGFILGTAELAECLPTEDLKDIDAVERALGNYAPKRFGWLLKNPTPLVIPQACRGMQGLFEAKILPQAT